MTGIRVQGARVVVTGCGSGIGEAAALRFAARGAEVVCVDVDRVGAEATAVACRAQGAVAHARSCDVADAASVAVLLEVTEREHGPVDVLVNSAGLLMSAPLLDGGAEHWRAVIGANLDSVAHGCRAFGAAMTRRGRGQVVNVASTAAYLPRREFPAYCASKAAVVALSDGLRAEWASSGVGVSVVSHGPIKRGVGVPAGPGTRVGQPLLGRSPAAVASAIVRATERNEPLVAVGLELRLLHRVLPHVPEPVRVMLARTPLFC